MDQAAKPVVIAASLLLAASLITLGVKAGSSDGGDPVNGDGPVAAGSESEPDAAPDATETDATAAPDASETDSAAPDATEPDDDGAPDDSATDGDSGAPDDGASGDSDSGQTDTSDLDDMPDTGGGTAMMLGGLVAAGSAVGLRRRR